MKTIRALLVGLLLAGLSWPLSASAQGVPPGSYLETCGNVYLRGNTLFATCQRMDDYSAGTTALPAVQSCVGDIGNMDGRLTCNYADAPTPPQPDYASGDAPRPDG
jgi:hypothetical protein